MKQLNTYNKWAKMLIALMLIMPSVDVLAQSNATLTLDNYQKLFRAKQAGRLDAVAGTDQYLKISDDGKRIEQYSFSTGKKTATVFDVDNTQGSHISDFDYCIPSPDGKRLLICTEREDIYRRSHRGRYFIYTISSRKLEPLSDGGKQQSPVWSKDGYQVAFVRDNNIFIVKLLYGNAEVQVTKDGAKNKVINGVPDWVNEEEFGFATAMTFNADGSKLCYLRYDESQVKAYDLQFFKGSNPTIDANADYPSLYSYKYPKAGQDNSKVTAWSYDIQTKRIQQLQVPIDADGYMPRILSTDDADKIVVYTMDRHQDRLCLYAVNPSSTLSTQILKEESKCYVREDNMEQVGIYGETILVPSDRDGSTRVYLYNINGQLLRTIGEAGKEITAVYGYDTKTGDVYYQTAIDSPYDRQICVTHKNGKTERLTSQAGWNSAQFSGDYAHFVNQWSDINTPPVVTLRDSRGRIVSTIEDNAELRQSLSTTTLAKRELFSFTTSEGIELTGWMVRPASFNSQQRYPVVMYQYSGPGSQQVKNSWNIGSMGQGLALEEYLAQQGYISVCVDGRGTAARGADFEKQIYQRMGYLEAKDQVETALYLKKLSYVDGDNIGIWGWSYGGFCTLMSMSEGRPVFKAGVAVAAPTSWRYYDSIYTERYMRTPQENPEGYADCPIARADKLSGALLLCHGLADDNVHPQNLFEYTEALIQADKDFKMNVYTNRNHSIYGGNTRKHLMRQITSFFDEHLK